MDERIQQELVATAQLGAEMREFCRHSGFKVLLKFIEGKVADVRNEWLRAPNAQEAEELRLQAKPWMEIESHLKKLMIEGDIASKTLAYHEEDLQ